MTEVRGNKLEYVSTPSKAHGSGESSSSNPASDEATVAHQENPWQPHAEHGVLIDNALRSDEVEAEYEHEK